jgi:carbamoylphosphate synthase small subunit
VCVCSSCIGLARAYPSLIADDHCLLVSNSQSTYNVNVVEEVSTSGMKTTQANERGGNDEIDIRAIVIDNGSGKQTTRFKSFDCVMVLMVSSRSHGQ